MYDVETRTLWSHILGEAKEGPLRGTKLEPLSTDMVTWATWHERHPETTVLNLSRVTSQIERGNDYKSRFLTEKPSEFVYGWSVGLRRYHVALDLLARQVVLNIDVANTPLVAAYDQDSTAINLFSPIVGAWRLSFVPVRSGQMRDEQTGSTWDVETGIALEGSLKGERLQRRLGMLSYAEAWRIFYPESTPVPSS